jgi:PAS domain S-box-containing protein
LPDTVAVLDHTGVILAVNQAWREFAAANGGGDIGVGDDYLGVCEAAAATDPVAAEVAAALRDMLHGRRDSYECVYPCHTPDRQRWLSVRLRPFDGGPRRGVVMVHHDITDAHLAQRQAHEQAELLAAVDAAVIAVDLEGDVTHWNAGAEELYGWRADEVLGRPARGLTVAMVNQELADAIGATIRSEGQWEGEFEARSRDGRVFPVYARNRLLHDAEGLPRAIIGVSVDMSERAEMERRLRGVRDFLSAVTDTVPDGLYVLDKDGRVTLINRTAEAMLGWEAGELLGEPMDERAHAARPASPMARARAAGGTVRVEDDLFQRKDGSLLPVSYASAPFITESAEQGWVVVFNDISERKEREARLRRELDALTWVGRIDDALLHDRFVLHAQPILDLQTRETVTHELLLRMVGSDGETIPPGAFLPIAEQHGQIGAIDRWVFEKALDYAQEGHPVEVNVSAASLGDPTLLEFVADRLHARAIVPELIVFEITETALMGNEEVARGFVEAIRGLGCGVALDDFGTGYGSFRYLKQIPVTVLKIDQEFVVDLDGPGRETSRHVIQAIVSLARGLGQKTVAEGVESATALDTLRELGVDRVQGYLLGRPEPADSVFLTPDDPAH